MLIRLLCAHEMTKHVCKISHLNSKRLLRKLQKNLGGYFILPHPVGQFSQLVRCWVQEWTAKGANSELTTLLLPYYLAKSECSAMQLQGKVSKIKVVQTLAANRLNDPRQTDKNTSPLLFQRYVTPSLLLPLVRNCLVKSNYLVI